MKYQTFFSLIFVILITSPVLSQNDIFPLSDIQPGMTGTGKTVFSGTEVEEFQFEVLDIIRNFKAKRDVILVKLIGENVEKTGVAFGMSGSPMYIDGKLIGALAYMMAVFSKEPIAGITPIEQMFEIFEQEKVRSQELASARGFNESFFTMAIGARDFDWQSFVPPYLQKEQTSASASITPLATPLVFSGFEVATLQRAAEFFDNPGFEIVQGGGTSSGSEEIQSADLQPGSAYSVVVVDGDFALQATGTVTYTEGDRVLGMGHPFLNTGAVGLPMGKARILTTLSSLMASTKMSSLTGVIGAIHQDRTTGVMGVTGESAEMIPFDLTFRSEFQEPEAFHFRIAEDRSLYSLTPLISNIVLANVLESARLSLTSQTLKLDGRINLKDTEAIPVNNYYAGSTSDAFVTDALQATGEVSAILGALLSNTFELPEIESVELDFASLPQKYLATVSKVEVDKTVLRPGENVTVTVSLQEYQGEVKRVQYTMQVPSDIKARRIGLFAGSGSLLTRLEMRANPQKFKPKSFKQLLQMLNSRRNNNYVFLQFRLRDKGLLVEGEEMPDLPPSILSVMTAQRATGNAKSLRDRILVEDKVEVDYAVSGGRTVWLKVDHSN